MGLARDVYELQELDMALNAQRSSLKQTEARLGDDRGRWRRPAPQWRPLATGGQPWKGRYATGTGSRALRREGLLTPAVPASARPERLFSLAEVPTFLGGTYTGALGRSPATRPSQRFLS